MRRALVVPVGVVLIVFGLGVGSTSAQPRKISPSRAAQIRPILPMLSGELGFRAAQALGIQKIMGKDITKQDRGPGSPPDTNFADQPVGASSFFNENEPSIAVNPQDESKVMAAFHHGPDPQCAAYYSYNGGYSWSYFLLPLTGAGFFCSDPVVRISPDGAEFLIAYMDIDNATFTNSVKIYRCDGAITSCDGPYDAIPSNGSSLFDKPWIGVHEFDSTQAGKVYVTATNFAASGDCDIVFASSSTYGVTWSGLTTLAASGGACASGAIPVLQGSHVAGGIGTVVLDCWYNSGTDGWLLGGFKEQCRTSTNGGATFNATVTLATVPINPNGSSSEVPYWLCPSTAYERVWGAGMFPSIAIAPTGKAVLVYSKNTDPTGTDSDGECGSLRIASSAASPYGPGTWSVFAPSEKANFQGFGFVNAQRNLLNGTCYLQVSYLTGQRSPIGSPNLLYDIYRIRSSDCGTTWGSPARITDAPSLSQFVFIGDYNDGSATARKVHVIWSDRADQIDIFASDCDVFTDVITV